uniref:SPARK domain-containing protein n=1 Tax=Elaeophora elaphi TaxID=1147741 RepID=A0A0R3RZK7_9BILA
MLNHYPLLPILSQQLKECQPSLKHLFPAYLTLGNLSLVCLARVLLEPALLELSKFRSIPSLSISIDGVGDAGNIYQQPLIVQQMSSQLYILLARQQMYTCLTFWLRTIFTPKAMASVVLLIIGLLMVQMTNSQAGQYDCNKDYSSPFCDEIQNKNDECYVSNDKLMLSPIGVHCAKIYKTCCMLRLQNVLKHAVYGQQCKDSNPVIHSILKSKYENDESRRLCPKTCNLSQTLMCCMGNQ